MNKIIVGLALILILAVPCQAFTPWIDTWNNGSYYTTNGEKATFNSLLGRSEVRVGTNVTEGLTDIPPLSPYIVSLVVVSQDKNYWNNNFALGLGIRSMPFTSYKEAGWMDEWIKDIKVFAEVLSLSYLKDETTAKTNQAETSDVRVGFDLYHEWNQKEPDKKMPWAEIWSNLSYRTTNFYQGGFKTYLLTHQQKIGMHLDNKTIKPYIRTDLTFAGRSEAWWNSIYVGPGIQIEPFITEEDPIFKNLKIYLEMLSIIWYKDNDSRPQSDIRFGVDYRLYIK